MSDLPTATFDADHPGELYLDDAFAAIGRRYALVPVNQVEKIWWCVVEREGYANDGCWGNARSPRTEKDAGVVALIEQHERADCGWRWLVKEVD